ncbi:MAG: polyprenyl synthetase family protein [bacterium]
MSPSDTDQTFLNELNRCVDLLTPYLLRDSYTQRFRPSDIQDAATMYVSGGGKRLRPAILLWSCGAVGGDTDLALPAAAAVEIFHTWTLVHDDIIDRDDMRRGGDSVHVRFRKRAQDIFHLKGEDADHYGMSVAILAGDVQHGWNVSMLTELTRKKGVPAEVTLALIRELNDRTLNRLIEGELLDLQYTRLPVGEPDSNAVEEMLRKKTGELYRFCAWGGAQIGLGRNSPEDPRVQALSDFALECGVAFQMQDDVLGLIGDPKVTGKPVGNDLREGKRTLVLHEAWNRADETQRALLRNVVGNASAGEEDVSQATQAVVSLGAVEFVHQQARDLISKALPKLDVLEPSRWRDLLASWADFMIRRQV